MIKPLAWSAGLLAVLAGAALAQTPAPDLDAALKKLNAPAPAKGVELPAQFKTAAPATAPAAQSKAATPPAASTALPKAAAPVVAQPSSPASTPSAVSAPRGTL
jgi:hypothetical protein